MKNLFIITILVVAVFTSCKKDKEEIQPSSNADRVKNILLSNLKAGYHFENFIGGKVKDFSGKNMDGNPSDLNISIGKYGNALLFNNSFSNFEIPTGIGEFNKGLTIDFWYKNSPPSYMSEYKCVIEEQSYGSNTTFFVRIDSTQKIYIEYDKSQTTYPGVKSTIGLEYDKWYHIAFVYDGTESKIYIDGDLNNSASLLMGTIDSWNRIYVGWSSYGESFSGYIDELRFCNYAFSGDEVKELMNIY